MLPNILEKKDLSIDNLEILPFSRKKGCIVIPDKNVYTLIQLDGVGPVDNRPSTDKLHNFVNKKLKN